MPDRAIEVVRADRYPSLDKGRSHQLHLYPHRTLKQALVIERAMP